MTDVHRYERLAVQLAVDSIRASTAARSGHPTSSLSAAHLMAVLYAGHLRADLNDPKHPANDRVVLSKGHASPLLYSIFKALGSISDRELLTFRKLDSVLQGHPVPLPETPLVDVATGSLGQGLPIGLGMALASRLDGMSNRIWVVMGDSELVEGSVWEAMANASHAGLDNLIGIVDVNRLGQRGPTMLGWDTDAYARRAEAFGWKAIVVDGHDVAAIDAAYRDAETAGTPSLVVARTVKGYGVSFLADKDGWHGKALSDDEALRAVDQLGGARSEVVVLPLPKKGRDAPVSAPAAYERPEYSEPVATRKAAGQGLAALARALPDVVVLDAEVGNSTHADEVLATAPDRYFQLYIAEQAMVGAAVGLQALGKIPFASTFAAFLCRAQDFTRMAAVSRADIRLVGSHAGVSIGEDGPSQMALEDLAAMRAVHGSTVLYPADGHATASLLETMAGLRGVSYMRTTREATSLLYGPNETFPVGGSKMLPSSESDVATIVGAGITVHEALSAASHLAEDGVAVRVVDAYSVKPIDAVTIRAALAETGLVVVVEDHWREGGLGDAVLDAIAGGGARLHGRVLKLAVEEMPGSGTGAELRERAGISARHISAAVRRSLVPGSLAARRGDRSITEGSRT
ncbi:MAG: transketolase [Actinomycetota bacterium]|nr:transketolase [Actinomycetota bacterium]